MINKSCKNFTLNEHVHEIGTAIGISNLEVTPNDYEDSANATPTILLHGTNSLISFFLRSKNINQVGL